MTFKQFFFTQVKFVIIKVILITSSIFPQVISFLHCLAWKQNWLVCAPEAYCEIITVFWSPGLSLLLGSSSSNSRISCHWELGTRIYLDAVWLTRTHYCFPHSFPMKNPSFWQCHPLHGLRRSLWVTEASFDKEDSRLFLLRISLGFTVHLIRQIIRNMNSVYPYKYIIFNRKYIIFKRNSYIDTIPIWRLNFMC